MPKGSRGEKRPADVIGGAVKVMRIAPPERNRATGRRRPHSRLESRLESWVVPRGT
jgi:hypothetical protein